MPDFYEPVTKEIDWPKLMKHYMDKGCSERKANECAHRYLRKRGLI